MNNILNTCKRCLNPWVISLTIVGIIGLIIFAPIVGVASLVAILPLLGCIGMCGVMAFFMRGKDKQ